MTTKLIRCANGITVLKRKTVDITEDSTMFFNLDDESTPELSYARSKSRNKSTNSRRCFKEGLSGLPLRRIACHGFGASESARRTGFASLAASASSLIRDDALPEYCQNFGLSRESLRRIDVSSICLT
jgi:hypothetical protein